MGIGSRSLAETVYFKGSRYFWTIIMLALLNQ
jgi:hypothetical protein